ncbi:hypothetical protein CBR_g47117 [Chara braunii]|uniref:PROP1-like PPR domain-containing protein n=1 Tax=Chara braunii TaxID=69332 RepID=A0A388M1F8_CHABU|nr:hypothetical protein CBR_g47117 [Chara braunii]|eukprot:GBG88418.1 hypothetical protein CBR_g47117 [Chara braunii]
MAGSICMRESGRAIVFLRDLPSSSSAHGGRDISMLIFPSPNRFYISEGTRRAGGGKRREECAPKCRGWPGLARSQGRRPGSADGCERRPASSSMNGCRGLLNEGWGEGTPKKKAVQQESTMVRCREGGRRRVGLKSVAEGDSIISCLGISRTICLRGPSWSPSSACASDSSRVPFIHPPHGKYSSRHAHTEGREGEKKEEHGKNGVGSVTNFQRSIEVRMKKMSKCGGPVDSQQHGSSSTGNAGRDGRREDGKSVYRRREGGGRVDGRRVDEGREGGGMSKKSYSEQRQGNREDLKRDSQRIRKCPGSERGQAGRGEHGNDTAEDSGVKMSDGDKSRRGDDGEYKEADMLRVLAERLSEAKCRSGKRQMSLIVRNGRLKMTAWRGKIVVMWLGRLGDWRMAVEFVKWMERRSSADRRPNSWTYMELLKILKKHRRSAEALEVLEKAKILLNTEGVSGTQLYNLVVGTLGRVGETERVLGLMEEMKENARRERSKEQEMRRKEEEVRREFIRRRLKDSGRLKDLSSLEDYWKQKGITGGGGGGGEGERGVEGDEERREFMQRLVEERRIQGLSSSGESREQSGRRGRGEGDMGGTRGKLESRREFVRRGLKESVESEEDISSLKESGNQKNGMRGGGGGEGEGKVGDALGESFDMHGSDMQRTDAGEHNDTTGESGQGNKEDSEGGGGGEEKEERSEHVRRDLQESLMLEDVASLEECRNQKDDLIGIRPGGGGGGGEDLDDVFVDMYGPDVHTYNAAFNACTSGGEKKRALSIFRRMMDEGVVPNSVTYGLLIEVMSRARDWKTAKGLFEDMLRQKLEPSLEIYQGLMRASASAGNLEGALWVMEEMAGRGIAPDRTVYSGLAFAFGAAGQWKRAIQIVNEMTNQFHKDWTYEDEVITYTGLIRACQKTGKWQDSIAVFEYMKKGVCPPNVGTCNLMISLYGRVGMFEKAKEVYEGVRRGGRDLFVAGADPEALVAEDVAGNSGRMSDDAAQCSASASQALDPPAFTSHQGAAADAAAPVLESVAGAADFMSERVAECLSEGEDLDIPVGLRTQNAVNARAGCMVEDAAEGASTFLAENADQGAAEFTSAGVTDPDQVGSDNAVDSMSADITDPDQFRSGNAVDRMSADATDPDQFRSGSGVDSVPAGVADPNRSGSAVDSSSGLESKEASRQRKLRRRVLHKGRERLSADDYTFQAMLTACVLTGEWAFAHEVHRSIVRFGSQPQRALLSSWLSACAKADQHQLAVQILRTMESADPISCAAATHSYAVSLVRRRRLEQAKDFLFQLATDRVFASTLDVKKTWHLVVRFMAAQGKADLATETISRMIEIGVGLDGSLFAVVIRVLVRTSGGEGGLRKAVDLLKKMEGEGFRADVGLCAALVRALAKEGLWAEVPHLASGDSFRCAFSNGIIEKLMRKAQQEIGRGGSSLNLQEDSGKTQVVTSCSSPCE